MGGISLRLIDSRKFLVPCVLCLVCLLAACRSKPEEKRYSLEGEVISIDVPNKLLTIKHGEIPGLMPAMAMNYVVAEPKEIAHLKPGDIIKAELVISENKGRLEKIVLVQKTTADTGAPVGAILYRSINK
jgi:Cu/Ag efflux protein CusF